MRVAYLGPEGTFTHETLAIAATRLNWKAVTAVPFPDQEAVVRAVAEGEAELGVVAVATSLGSEMPVAATIANLPLQVIEVVERVCHYALLALAGTQLEDVRTVLSNPKALADCRATLGRLLTAHDEEMTGSTAQAVARVRELGRADLAAVGTETAGRHYGLMTLAAAIEDDPANWTRWTVIRRAPEPAAD